MEDLTIRQIIERVNNGQIRIPAFQRGFVWDPNMVAYLMDSLYKNYPIGALLVWRTNDRLEYERKLGPYDLPEPTANFPIDYVLDGQQRITSIFGVFQSDLIPTETIEWNDVYFDLEADLDVQESQFVNLSTENVEVNRHFPLRVLFNTVEYRRATRGMTDEVADKVDQLQTVFRELRVPTQMIETEDRTTVAIVFERVNQRGVPLDTLQLLTAWTWSEQFDLHREFETLSEDLEPFGFSEVGDDNNLLLRCCAAVIAHDASIETLIELNGNVVRERFREVINGLKGAIDFLRNNLEVHSISNLPYSNILIPLSVFFAVPGNQQVNFTDNQRRTILNWFWKTCFSRRYNSQPLKTIKRDIVEIDKLRRGEASTLNHFDINNVPAELFRSEAFRINNINTKTFILLLAQAHPESFISGNPVTLGEVLRDYNRREFHHVYPKAYLENSGNELNYNVNSLANFCFLSRTDNNQIRAKSPSTYREEMPENLTGILTSNLLPTETFSDDFNSFIEERSLLLAEYANQIIDSFNTTPPSRH